jgi:hypothetical protein
MAALVPGWHTAHGSAWQLMVSSAGLGPSRPGTQAVELISPMLLLPARHWPSGTCNMQNRQN